MRNQKGYTLIELIITLVILGLVVYFLIHFCSQIIVGSEEEEKIVRATNLAISQMEGATSLGLSISSQDWTPSPPFEWNRAVRAIKSDSLGNPTLVEVEMQIRVNRDTVYSLITHLAK